MENKEQMQTITIKELALKHGYRVDLLRTRMCRSVFTKYRVAGKINVFNDVPKLHEQIQSTMRIYEVKDTQRKARKLMRDNIVKMRLQEMGA